MSAKLKVVFHEVWGGFSPEKLFDIPTVSELTGEIADLHEIENSSEPELVVGDYGKNPEKNFLIAGIDGRFKIVVVKAKPAKGEITVTIWGLDCCSVSAEQILSIVRKNLVQENIS